MQFIAWVQHLNIVTHGLLYPVALAVGGYLLALIRHSVIGKKIANAETLLTHEFKALVGEKTYGELVALLKSETAAEIAKYLGLPVRRVLAIGLSILKDLFPAPEPAPAKKKAAPTPPTP